MKFPVLLTERKTIVCCQNGFPQNKEATDLPGGFSRLSWVYIESCRNEMPVGSQHVFNAQFPH